MVSHLFRLRRGSIWSLTLGGLNFFPSTSVLVGSCWDFHRSWKSLVCCRSFRYWGWLLWRRRVRTWERLNIRIIVYALRPPKAGVSRDPNGINGFFPSNVAVVPGDRRKFFSQPALSLFHPQSIRGLLLGLGCLLL